MIRLSPAGGGFSFFIEGDVRMKKYALKLHICNGKFSHMCLLKPFVLKNEVLRDHFTRIMHNMHKNMHIRDEG